jgi:hypothetical protein
MNNILLIAGPPISVYVICPLSLIIPAWQSVRVDRITLTVQRTVFKFHLMTSLKSMHFNAIKNCKNQYGDFVKYHTVDESITLAY